ncbi:MAG TPA: hypothetical protein VN843_08135 [Anaerolineales bacterium]|nr:hypothetical protein [Anaerolineales bacterium]
MNPFEPASLSPMPKTPVPCLLPYNLTWDDLRSILPGFEPESNTIQAFSSYEKQGLNGGANSCILTLRYLVEENQFRSETIFIKRATDMGSREAQKYLALASLDIPTPRLLADIYKNNAEIILLEFLPKIGIDFQSAAEVNSLLHLAAQLNSILNPPEIFGQSGGGIPQAEFDRHVRGALKEIARDRSLPLTVNIPRWFDAYQIACIACKSMPRAVNHNEFSFQQVGWVQRDGKNQLVIFDLETMSLSPRFTDIAGILPGLAIYTGQSQNDLFKIYFDRLCELNALELEFDKAFHELRLVQVKDAFDSLPWLVDVAKRPDLNRMLDDPLSRCVNTLNDGLVALGFL